MLFGIRGTVGPLLSTGLSGHLTLSWMLLFASACGWIGTLLFAGGMLRRGRGEPESAG
ncbi:hypothetical protein [Paenibacillus sp. B01]|nr:hypothetical protein [Paenibacillus sp. B01]